MRSRIALGAAALALLAVVVIGVLQSSSTDEGPNGKTPSLTEAKAKLAGAPAPLAALHAQANTLQDGSADALKTRLTALKGYPVVVNKWASWCGPCRAEFDSFQRVSVKLGKRVAFLGVDYQDDGKGDAAAFLAAHPLSYPSLVDVKGTGAARELSVGRVGPPQTIFVDAQGRQTIHSGPYLSDKDLEADIKKYTGA